MIPWRKVAVLGFVGTCLLAGCTVTSSDGTFDGGATGGAGNTGGAGSVGGTGAGGTSTIVDCNPAAGTTGSCGFCIQTADTAGGLCNEYKVCGAANGCATIINAMATCMSGKVVGGNIPMTADAECRASTAGMSVSDTSAAARAAQTFWDQIQVSLCSVDCWAV